MAKKLGKTVVPVKPEPQKYVEVNFPEPTDKLVAEATARFVIRASVNAAAVVGQYTKETFGDQDMAALATSLSAGMNEVNGGDLKKVEAMLYGQAHALQSIFTNMARRAPKQDLMSHWEAFMRVALKAQNQCRMTLETLATIKNPPAVFARQANINNGGQQQVNNGPNASPRARETQTSPNELSGGSDELLQDTRASQAPSGANSGMEPVEAIDRTAQR
jgi:hypothetical protein